MVPLWYVISCILVTFQKTFIVWQGSNYASPILQNFSSFSSLHSRNELLTFNFEVLTLSFYKIFDIILVIRRTNILEIRLLFPQLRNDSLEYILFSCLHYIKRTENYQFSFKINGKMGCDFLILKRVAKKINFSIFQLLLRKLQHYISHIIEIISKITSINLSIQEKNKIN